MNENAIFYICSITAFLSAYCFNLIDSVHFFQLNSYRHDTHRKWLSQNKRKIIVPLIFGALSFGAFFLHKITAVVFVLFALVSIPKKAKKPLVYTPRVKRMLITAGLITFVPLGFVIALCKDLMISSALMCLYIALAPFIMLISDLINKPMEKCINKGYTKDAEKILAQCPDLKIIGITGSFGKTSVKYYLNSLLQTKYNVLMTPESFNTPMGVVKTIRGSLKSTHEIFICEMGAKWVGDIKELCDIVHPQNGIITSVGPQHLESFGSLDNVKKTKFELAQEVGEKGILLLNGDDENIKSVNCSSPHLTYTIDGDGDYNASDISVSSKGTCFTVTAKSGEKETFSTKLIGKHNVINITGAIAMAHQMGVPMSLMKGAVRKLEGVPHRLALSETPNATIIDDAYNSNPTGSKTALEVLSVFEGYKIVVTPGMVELGEKQYELNKKFGEYMAQVCDYVVLVGRKQAEPMKEGLLEKGFSESKIYIAGSINEALNHTYSLNSKGKKKIILLENDLPDNY